MVDYYLYEFESLLQGDASDPCDMEKRHVPEPSISWRAICIARHIDSLPPCELCQPEWNNRQRFGLRALLRLARGATFRTVTAGGGEGCSNWMAGGCKQTA